MDEFEFMEKSYGLFYKIENILRVVIDRTMRKHYGIDWIIQAPLSMNYLPYKKHFSAFYFHELISQLKGYPCLTHLFPHAIILQLEKTVSIRNKIAHCKLLSSHEFHILCNLHRSLITMDIPIKYTQHE